MGTFTAYKDIVATALQTELGKEVEDMAFANRMAAHSPALQSLFTKLYGAHPKAVSAFEQMIGLLVATHQNRSVALQQRDDKKATKGHWYLSNEMMGMSLYVDRFCDNLQGLTEKLDYFKKLGVNLLHLMPLFESPLGESDGGYAVSDFKKINAHFGSIEDLAAIQQQMHAADMSLMIDIVLNHSSRQHEWAQKAKAGDAHYQQYFYMYDDRALPDALDQSMHEIFPTVAPGNFTYVPECDKWVMTVFHEYQWDLNFSNPALLVEMLDIILWYANLGVDVLRIDAPAFIWKEAGTNCQNLPKAHTILRLIKQCVTVAAPGMALLGEAIVAPKDIIDYFGKENYTAQECDLAYNATQMALQWDALATADTRIMLAAQKELLKKPFGTSWITYTRCHDDIGLGYDDEVIRQVGFNPYQHRRFLKEFYSGARPDAFAKGALFSVHPITQDARISGTLASLCGLEKALSANHEQQISTAIDRMVLMQACSFFVGGLPMLFSGDELGYINDYAYLQDASKNYDNRWMHRPIMDWKKAQLIDKIGSVEQRIFSATQRLISIRKKLPPLSDYCNIEWLSPYNIHVAGFVRTLDEQRLYCLFNFSPQAAYLDWKTIREKSPSTTQLFDHWQEQILLLGQEGEYLIMAPYSFYLLEAI